MLNVISMEYIVALYPLLLINALVDMIIILGRRFHQKGHQTCYNILGMPIHWGGGGKSNHHNYGVGVCGLAGVGVCGLAGVGVCGRAVWCVECSV